MYMKYRRVRLDARLFNSKHAIADVSFTDGCNVILTDSNTQGKSSLINALAVGLGFDELVKSNVSALVNDAIKIEGKDIAILDAAVYLEIKNQSNEYLSIKREIRPELAKGFLVSRCPLEEWREEETEEYYVGSGSYTDTKGFHRLLSDFIGFPDIQVISQDEGSMRLYLEYIFSAIFIEQKRGWADIMSNAPYYGMRDPKKSTISEILGLDYIKNNLQKNALNQDITKLKAIYEGSVESLRQRSSGAHFSVRGIPNDMVSDIWAPRIFRSFEGKDATLEQITKHKVNQLSLKQTQSGDNKSQRPDVKKIILELSEKLNAVMLKERNLSLEIGRLDDALQMYEQRMLILSNDLEKYREEQKIRKIFSHDNWSTQRECPVCQQPIDESLLPQIRTFPTMSIDVNIKYIVEQKDLLQNVIGVEKGKRNEANMELATLHDDIRNYTKQLSDFQSSLTGPVPADLMVLARDIARLEREIEGLQELAEYSEQKIEDIKKILDTYRTKHRKLATLKSDLSDNDSELLCKFEKVFKDFLMLLGYNSLEIGTLVIDKKCFVPRVVIGSAERKKHVRADFGSSASDWIRIMTAYTLALHSSRNNTSKSNHPNVSVFDEPAQQKMDMDDHLKFYDIVSKVCESGGQVIIAETDKDHSVKKKALQLNMNVVDFGSEYVLEETNEGSGL